MSLCKNKKTNPKTKLNLGSSYLTPFAKFNSEQIIDLGVRKETIKLLKEDIGGNICHLGLGKNFLHMTYKQTIGKS